MASGVTQNGYSIDPGTRAYPVPGTGVTLELIADADVALPLVWAAWCFHQHVQALDPDQCGGYDKRPIGGLGGSTSNHRSGTACDLNYSNFPQGPDRMNQGQKDACHAIIAAARGVLRWGGDYGGGTLLDQQHF